MLRVIIFAILSAALAYVSRASLKVPRFHGFYRFFAWECILALFFLNFISFRQWIGDPLSVRQLISWVLLIGCIVPGVYGVHLLRTQGKPDARRPHDVPLVWIEKTTRLATTGVFKYIRHPLYSSLLLLAWGVFFKRPSWVAGGVALGATAFLPAHPDEVPGKESSGLERRGKENSHEAKHEGIRADLRHNLGTGTLLPYLVDHSV